MTQYFVIGMFLVCSYLIGSLPFGLWIAFWLKGVDIRTVGSGNIGATNVSRVCGPGVGRAVFVLDLLKGAIPPLIGDFLVHLNSHWIVLGALLAIIGHNYSILLGFKGGKGISTSGGALLGAAPLVGLCAIVIFGLVTLATSIISVGSLAAAITLPFIMFRLYPHDPYRIGFGIAAAIMAIYKHRKNIERLMKGTEPKVQIFGGRSGKNDSASASTSEPVSDPEPSPQNSQSPSEKATPADASH